MNVFAPITLHSICSPSNRGTRGGGAVSKPAADVAAGVVVVRAARGHHRGPRETRRRPGRRSPEARRDVRRARLAPATERVPARADAAAPTPNARTRAAPKAVRTTSASARRARRPPPPTWRMPRRGRTASPPRARRPSPPPRTTRTSSRPPRTTTTARVPRAAPNALADADASALQRGTARRTREENILPSSPARYARPCTVWSSSLQSIVEKSFARVFFALFVSLRFRVFILPISPRGHLACMYCTDTPPIERWATKNHPRKLGFIPTPKFRVAPPVPSNRKGPRLGRGRGGRFVLRDARRGFDSPNPPFFPSAAATQRDVDARSPPPPPMTRRRRADARAERVRRGGVGFFFRVNSYGRD